MAEAHSAVAFSFSVTPEGVDVRFNHEAIKAIWYSGLRSWRKRVAHLKNNLHNNVYPVSPFSGFLSLALVIGCYLSNFDISYGLIDILSSNFIIQYLTKRNQSISLYIAMIIFSLVLWLLVVLSLRYILKLLLMYHGWMFEPRGTMSLPSKIWMSLVRLLVGRKPLLFSYQGSIPKQPVPKLEDTLQRYLTSIRPLVDDSNYSRMVCLVKEFQEGIGKRLQKYLILKSWWATNYVSDWWEEYVYLRGRSPIMVNSNYYAIDAVLIHLTTNQAARAANSVYAFLQFRRLVVREELTPIMVNKTVPLCSRQYERQFNTTRIPGIETDTLMHLNDSRHIAVYHKGRYYKVYIYYKHQLLEPCQLEVLFQKILDDNDEPCEGERELAALTAGERVPWAKARQSFFSDGVNKDSLEAIEKAAFVLVLDEKPQYFSKEKIELIDEFANDLLYGNGHNRWFDKSFNLVVSSNGRVGFNAEHSWADAPVMAHMWEYGLIIDSEIGYTEDGHTKGYPTYGAPNPIRLKWNLSKECQEVIQTSLGVAREIFLDVDLHLHMHCDGKGVAKKCKLSPDAFVQMALQLAYYRDMGKFCLTYEASMTRLFREGRTETVRSCTIQSCAFVKAMINDSIDKKEKIRLLNEACEVHQNGYKFAMTGAGIDRHLFCLYVVSKYLAIDSPLLKEVLSEPWMLSTSQTPHTQTERLDIAAHPDLISAGGGFGPVADDGYGVSYIFCGEDVTFFHISSKKSCKITDSHRFADNIVIALNDLKNLFK